MRKVLLLIVILFTGFSTSFASHIPGGNITWQCTGNPNEYIVTMQMMVSCNSSLSNSYTGTISNTCGLTNPTLVMSILPQVPGGPPNPLEVSQICDAQLPNSACNGGTIPGVMMYTYQTTVILPAGCNTWDFAFELCCRDANSNTTGGSGNDMYFHSGMNSITAPCDASPIVTAAPIPYVCAGQPNTYCPGAIDPDGDSLSYSLINPLGGGGTPFGYNLPYTTAAPLQNLIMDPATGCITFNQPTIGNFVVTYLIEAWDAAGNLTGFIVHDFQFEVITCTNVTPNPPVGGIVLTSGNATQLGPNLIELCEGENACFSMTFTDPDMTDTLSIDTATSNIFAVFPGAIITTTGTNPFEVNICWTVPAGSPSQLVATLTITDGACPIEGTASQVAIFDVITSTVANPDTVLCGTQAAQLTGTGGSVFTWSIVPGGDPIVVGTNFSCNPCNNPIATPAITTTYIVTSNLSGGCDNVDTTVVTIVPDFTLSTFGDSLLCDYYSVPIGATAVPAGAYTAVWNPGATLNNASILTPIASPLLSTTYYTWVTSGLGCTKFDSVVVDVNPPPSLTLVPGDTVLCDGESLQFEVESTCDYTLDMFDSFGDGWNGQSIEIYEDGVLIGTYTVPTGSSNTEIFSITNGSTITIVYNTGAFQSESSFNLIDGTGTTQFAVAQGSMTGWLQGDLVFTGIANCGPTLGNYTFSWAPAAGLSDPNISNPIATPTVTTAYTVTLTDIGGCTIDRTQTITVAPDFTLTTYGDSSLCGAAPVNIGATGAPAGAYTAIWNPSATLSNGNILNPIASPTQSTTYYAWVSSAGGCTKFDSVVVDVNPIPNGTLIPGDTTICAGAPIQFDISLASLNDNFDAGFDPSIWSSVQGNSATGTACGTPSGGGNALHFDGSGTRELVTNPMAISNCVSIDFCLFIGNSSSGGSPCENADTGEDVILNYSINGGASWVPIQTFLSGDWDPAGPYNNTWQCFTIPIPAGALTANTLFQWEQPSHSGTLDNWSIDDVSLNCGGNSSYDYSWSPGIGLIDSTVSNPVVTPAVTTVYSVSITDTATGCSTILTQTVTVVSGFTVSSVPNDTTICLGEMVNFNVTASTPGAYIYNWSPGNIMNDSTLTNPIGTFTTPGNHTIIIDVELPGCAIKSDTMVISVTNPLAPSVNLTNITCKDDMDGKIIMTPNFGPGSEVQSFVWTDSITGAILQNSINLSAGMQDSLINLGPGAYTITMTDTTGCSADTTVWITEPDSVTISSITPDDIICIGGTTPISATTIGGTGAAYTLTWLDVSAATNIPGNGPHNVSPTVSPSCYAVFATDISGCNSSPDQVCFLLYDTLAATTTNNAITICPGASTNVDVNVTGGSGTGYNYEWYENGTQIGTGGTINVTPTSSPTTYIGVGYDDCTTPSDSVLIVVDWHGLVIPDFTRNKPDSCYPITVQFTNTSTPAALVGNSVWTFSGGTTLNGDPVSNTFSNPACQDVTLTVTTIDGCVVDITKTDFVCPQDYPIANYSMNPPITNILDTEVDFTDLSYGGVPPYTYLWNFNSGLTPDSSNATNPTFNFPDNAPGNYPVLLRVTDFNGCQDTILGTVIINGIYLFYVPNSFTPDGDGLNETFRPYGEGIDFTNYTMQIFDRWGNLIYSTDNAEIGWDGTFNGTPVEVDTYVWKIIAKEEFSPIIHDNFGHITIIK